MDLFWLWISFFLFFWMGPKNKIRNDKNKYNESEKLGEVKKSNKTHKKEYLLRLYSLLLSSLSRIGYLIESNMADFQHFVGPDLDHCLVAECLVAVFVADDEVVVAESIDMENTWLVVAQHTC